MKIENQHINGKSNMHWMLRCPTKEDASELSKLRIQIDGETEYLDREAGEGILLPEDFTKIIEEDIKDEKSLFLVAEVEGKIVGFTRCVGNKLSRFKHKADFGICISKEYWGYGIGQVLLRSVVMWADKVEIDKISLTLVETNIKAIGLYKKYGFVEEGLLVKDRIHKDGNYYNTLIMGRFRPVSVNQKSRFQNKINIIHIVGASGSGTTTLGRALEQTYGYHHLDVDDYYWLPTDPPFTTPREISQRIQMLNDEIQKHRKCVISGSLCGWGDCLIPYFDLILRVVTPTKVRLERLENREFNQFGSRILPKGDMYDEHIKFIKWAEAYDTGDASMRSKALHDEWLKNISCKQIVIDGTKDMEEILTEINPLLGEESSK